MKEEIAIIIPAYKSAYLRVALESVAQQTCRRFHVYIGDDCSPEDLATITAEYEQRMPLTYHRFDRNIGGTDLVAQWERCIALSRDEKYIWLFSDDDIMQPGCVESFFELPAEVRDNNLVHFNLEIIDGVGNIVRTPRRYPVEMTAVEYIEQKRLGHIISFVVEFVFPRSFYDKVGGFVNFDLAWGSDYMTWVKMALLGHPGIVTVAARGDNSVMWRESELNISPDRSRPVVMRKMKAQIAGTALLKKMIEAGEIPTVKYGFGYAKLPWGEMMRNRESLTYADISELAGVYRHMVGYTVLSRLLTLYLWAHILLDKVSPLK